MVSPDNHGPLNWVGGLYYQHDYVTLLPGGGRPGFDIGVPPGVVDLQLNYRTPKTTEAVFGQVSYDLTPALQLQVGARYTHETFGLTDDSPTIVLGTVVADPVVVAHTSDSGPTGKVALTWKVNPDNTLYAFVATGRKAAGINTTPAGTQADAAPFSPERVTDFEAGWKPTFFDGHLRAQFGGYYSLYKDYQLSFALPADPATSFIRNLGGTTTLYGLEAEAQAVFGQLSFDASASYEHSSLGDATVVDPGNPAHSISLGGRQAPLAPTWTANFGVQYAFAIADGTLTPRIDYSYVSGQWSTPYQDLGDFLKARSLVNAELAWARRDYRVTLYATNAFDLHYIIATNVGLRYAGNPAQYGIRVAKRLTSSVTATAQGDGPNALGTIAFARTFRTWTALVAAMFRRDGLRSTSPAVFSAGEVVSAATAQARRRRGGDAHPQRCPARWPRRRPTSSPSSSANICGRIFPRFARWRSSRRSPGSPPPCWAPRVCACGTTRRSTRSPVAARPTPTRITPTGRSRGWTRSPPGCRWSTSTRPSAAWAMSPGSQDGACDFVDIFPRAGFASKAAGSQARRRPPRFVPAKAGDVIFHQARTVHMARANRSEQMRRVYTCIYFRDGCTRAGQSRRTAHRWTADRIAVSGLIAGARHADRLAACRKAACRTRRRGRVRPTAGPLRRAVELGIACCPGNAGLSRSPCRPARAPSRSIHRSDGEPWRTIPKP